jgi:hypothetical protein
VDRALADGGLLVALWDGEKKGGTWGTVRYAGKVGLDVANAWEDWQRFRADPGVFTSVPVPEEAPDGDRMAGLGDPARQA